MLSLSIVFLYLAPFLAITSTNAAPQASTYVSAPSITSINLRIEGQNNTIFEGPITSGPRNILLPGTPSGIGYPCNGLNNGANPNPGNTPTDALDAASKAYGFTYNGVFDSINNDFYITKIATSDIRSAINVGWAILVNYQIPDSPAGFSTEGCETECKAGDDVLWAFVTYEQITTTQQEVVFLKLAPTAVTVKKGKVFTVTVTNARTGSAVKNATVDGVYTDAEGKATLHISFAGVFQLKAHLAPPSIRSNVMNVTVT